MSTELEFLRERLEGAIGDRRDVTRKRMFGCDAYFRNDRIFALVWKESRLGVKLPDEASYAELANVKGAEPWSPGGKMVMGAWLLVPASWNEDEDKLRPWLERAHAQASLPPPTRKRADVRPAKKTSKKTAAKKVSAPKKKATTR